MNKVILLKNRPTGEPTENDFKITKENMPVPGSGEILLKSLYISVDPYLRGRMRDEESYIEPFEIDKPIESMVIARIEESKNQNFAEGDLVSGMLQWKEYQVSSGKSLNKLPKETKQPSAYLGILGLTGLTAYIALDKIGNLSNGETLVVSGAAGAVGSTVGQIAKIKGCRVVGIAGSNEKIKKITEDFGFDAGINYKTSQNIKKDLESACPDGIDVYFDNVGGEILDAVMTQINSFARIINCGAISLYNETQVPTGPRHEGTLIKKSALMQGFLVRNHAAEFGPALKQLSKWLEEGKLKYEETRVEGFDNLPKAFLDLFKGNNTGKLVVKI